MPIRHTCRRFVRLVRSFRRRSPTDRRALLAAGTAVFGIGVLLRVMPYARIQSFLEWVAPARPTPSAETDPFRPRDERRILWAVAAVSRRLFPQRPCLPQALAAQHLLRRANLPVPDLRFGVKRHAATGQLAAHAWLERDGKTLLGGPLSSEIYQPLTPKETESGRAGG
jgi:hypothetical protein